MLGMEESLFPKNGSVRGLFLRRSHGGEQGPRLQPFETLLHRVLAARQGGPIRQLRVLQRHVAERDDAEPRVREAARALLAK